MGTMPARAGLRRIRGWISARIAVVVFAIALLAGVMLSGASAFTRGAPAPQPRPADSPSSSTQALDAPTQTASVPAPAAPLPTPTPVAVPTFSPRPQLTNLPWLIKPSPSSTPHPTLPADPPSPPATPSYTLSCGPQTGLTLTPGQLAPDAAGINAWAEGFLTCQVASVNGFSGSLAFTCGLSGLAESPGAGGWRRCGLRAALGGCGPRSLRWLHPGRRTARAGRCRRHDELSDRCGPAEHTNQRLVHGADRPMVQPVGDSGLRSGYRGRPTL